MTAFLTDVDKFAIEKIAGIGRHSFTNVRMPCPTRGLRQNRSRMRRSNRLRFRRS